MSAETIILALITSLTIGHILFLVLHLWIKTGKNLQNRLLSLLLFCYSLRIIKSVLLLVFPAIPFADALIALGVIGMSAIGPLLWFFVQSRLKENFTIRSGSLLHFIPSVILMPTAFFLGDNAMFHVYQVSVYLIIAYLIVSVAFYQEWLKENSQNSSHKWISELLITAGLLSIVFLIQLYTNSRSIYVIVSIFAAILFYIISLRATFGNNAKTTVKRKTNGNQLKLLPVIEERVREDQLFLDPKMTVSKLALALKIPVHILSAAINEESGMAFNEFLNTFRVKEAAARLTSSDYELLSVEGIAKDCGFKSLSAFYNAFRKVYNITPARYRQQPFPDSLNQEDMVRNPERT